jgi:5'-nucleotidase (lipoprotein e(P4) family)
MRKVIIFGILMLLCSSVIAEETGVKDESALLGVLYHQTAAEYTALCRQAYNLASDRLLALDMPKQGKPAAIILDVDETVLDNSRYNALELLGKVEYPQGFNDWLDEMQSEPIAGAREFLVLADSLGIKIFYITNRRDDKKDVTLGNLQKSGYPQAVAEQVLCRTKESSKEPRRAIIAEQYDIVLLLGDDLIDFSDCFGGNTPDERKAAVENYREEFGRRFIMLPNVMHGSWLKLLDDYEYNLSEEECLNKRLKYLKY